MEVDITVEVGAGGKYINVKFDIKIVKNFLCLWTVDSVPGDTESPLTFPLSPPNRHRPTFTLSLSQPARQPASSSSAQICSNFALLELELVVVERRGLWCAGLDGWRGQWT